MFIVSKDGSSAYATLQSALDAIPDNAEDTIEILVLPGEYREKVHIAKPNVKIRGANAYTTRLVWSDSANQIDDHGQPKGTFCSYTFMIASNNVRIENITIENDAGPGDLAGQAIAAYVAGDRVVFEGCRLLGCQDTLYLGPVLSKAAQNALPYILPVQAQQIDSPAIMETRVYFHRCFIKGDVDFIFGSAAAWFEECTLFCNERRKPINGYITAANTPISQPYGFVFRKCRITGDAAPASVYLGRPWREYASTIFLHCEMGDCIHPAGFSDWEKPFRSVTERYAEYGSTGPGGSAFLRHAKARQLTTAEAEMISPEAVLAGSDGWAPHLSDSCQGKEALQ